MNGKWIVQTSIVKTQFALGLKLSIFYMIGAQISGMWNGVSSKSMRD